jgi:hypothetical protein
MQRTAQLVGRLLRIQLPGRDCSQNCDEGVQLRVIDLDVPGTPLLAASSNRTRTNPRRSPAQRKLRQILRSLRKQGRRARKRSAKLSSGKGWHEWIGTISTSPR